MDDEKTWEESESRKKSCDIQNDARIRSLGSCFDCHGGIEWDGAEDMKIALKPILLRKVEDPTYILWEYEVA